MDNIAIAFAEELYPKEAVMKAAYHFVNRAYIHVDFTDGRYLVVITPKKGFAADQLALEFQNEMLTQSIRHQVYLQTHVLREVLMARAMASTISGGCEELSAAETTAAASEELESILIDWFDKNEQ